MDTQEQRIKVEAEEKAQSKLDHLLPHQPAWRRGYIAGATKEAERAKVLIWALDKIKDTTNNSTIRIMITNALQDYKK